MVSQKQIKEMEEEEHKKYHRRLLYVFIVILLVLFGGATFYYLVEGWRYLDALYFSAYTMTTVGYGDFVPKTDAGKIFTIFYVFVGVAIALYGLSLMASHFVEAREEFWLEKLGKIKLKHTKTFWERLKNLFNYKSEELVKEYEKSVRGEK
ncbi:two pore domain potassium channel family protein [Candidatus Woesearchaeota archaeon]|nr:two pore domain potassium channel family protein [Candidatus Woesearchaeota archaeon]